jgi:LuxR family quorum-sensing system transcriptional regulator SolR
VLRFEQYIEKAKQSQTIAELARLFSETVEPEGYENCILTSLRGHKVGHVAWFDFRDGYAEAYIAQRWQRIGSVLTRSQRTVRPFFWGDVIDQKRLLPTGLGSVGECATQKVHSGIAFPFHAPGDRLDLLSISRRLDDQPDPARVSLLHAVSVQAWIRYVELSQERLFEEPARDLLTTRELEILRWCRNGKTRPEIGEILEISHKTVEFHLANIMNKLGANNQITAVVIALHRGLIDFQEPPARLDA